MRCWQGIRKPRMSLELRRSNVAGDLEENSRSSMSDKIRLAGLSIARFAAVVVALVVGGYLVVSAQRRAQPAAKSNVTTSTASESAPPVIGEPNVSTIATPSAEANASEAAVTQPNPSFLPSSKVLVIDSPLKRPDEAEPYLLGSKSGVLTPIANDGNVPPAVQSTAQTPPTTPPVFLPTSKSAAPLFDIHADGEVEIFLPSSKSGRVGSSLRPALKPGIAPAAPTATPAPKPAPESKTTPTPQPPKSPPPRGA